MLDILYCLRDEHDPRLVALAAAVCLLSSITAILMVRQSRHAQGNGALSWVALGGFATGFGIWATHFIAMLGYDPGFIAGYQAGLTLGSLGIALTTTIAAFVLASRYAEKRVMIAAASVIAGSGFAAMHYVGMAALEMPALINWQPSYVALSVAFAIIPLYPALALAVRGVQTRSGAAAALILCGAIIGLHFTGMTAIELIPSRMEIEATIFSSQTMSILISGVSMGLLALCVAGWLVSRRTRAAISASERQFSILVKGISDCAIYMLDRNGFVANWNAGAERLKGYAFEEIVGAPLSRFYTEEDIAAGVPQRALATAIDHGKFTGEGWRQRKDGTRFWAHVTIERIHNDIGKHVGFAKITRDMTRFKQDQDDLEEARRHRDAALEHMHQGLCLFDAGGQLVLRNRRFAELWGLPADSCAQGISLLDMARTIFEARGDTNVSDERLESIQEALRKSLDDPDRPPTITEFGDDFVVSTSSRKMPDGGWVTTFEDITERRRSEAKIAHMALHDALTGLPNRISFNHWLDRAVGQAAARDEQIALVAIDLDRFKEVNDSQGHAAGDLVLQKIAAALSSAMEGDEISARLGGDEFAAAQRFTDAGQLSDFIARVNGAFASLASGDEGVGVGASLGIAIYPEDATDRETLLNNADLAMYRAKASVGEHICYYEPGMDENARRRRQIANDLRQAIARDEMKLLYQPQRSLKTQAISGYEALLRWHNPRLGPITPTEFIPIAEETGEIIRIGEWVLEAACREAAQWPGRDKIAVNLSPVQLLQSDLPATVMRILMQAGLAPSRLELEITETALIADKVRALHNLRRIKALGVTVAMDDFGTGYSSLDTLHSFPFDKIKIDKSFLLQSESNNHARAIIRAILALGKSLGIPVLAEGVETKGQLGLLIGEGCDEAQGYYFGKPAEMPQSAPPPIVVGTMA